MKNGIVAAAGATILSFCAGLPALSAPTSWYVTIPLRFGGPHVNEPSAPAPTAAQLRTERRLRLARYGFQIADAIVSLIGYKAYQKCLSCLAYPGGGPRGSMPFSVADISGQRSAEANPLVVPFSRGGFASLALGAVAYDLVDAQVEKHWSVLHRETADVAEIGAHAWGISTWIPEIANIQRDATIAARCGAQWSAKQFGQAFSDGCVNRFYRPGAPVSASPAPPNVIFVCAPATFKHGSYLFSTASDEIVASGNPCADSSSALP